MRTQLSDYQQFLKLKQYLLLLGTAGVGTPPGGGLGVGEIGGNKVG